MSTPTAKALAAFGDTSGGSEGSPTSRKSPTAKAKLDTGAIANPMMKMLSVKVLGNIKMKAKKIKRKAVGIGHKPYRTRLQIIDPADSKTWLTAYLTFKNYKLTCHHTSLVKKSSGTGVTYKEWVVGKLIVELNCEQSARITILPSNVKEFACKVETEKRSVYIACSNEVLRNRLLRGLQPVCTMTSYAGAPTPNPICAFCGRKGCEKYVPRTDVSLLPAPFASVSDKVCEGCWRENDETRRREVTANVVDVRRKPGSLLHSEMKMFTNAMPQKSMLPPSTGNIDSFINDIKRECLANKVRLPAPQVDLIELGKKKVKAQYRPINGRLENKFEWRRQKESNYVVDEHVRLDFMK